MDAEERHPAADDGSGDEAPDEARRALERRTMRKVRMRVLPVTAAIYSISAVEKRNISLAAEGVMRDLSVSERQFGMISSLYFLPYALLALPIVLLIKPYGPRLGLGAMAVSFGAVSMATAAASSFPALLALRLLLGATEGPVFPFTSYVVSVFFGHDSGARALAEMGIYAGVLAVVMAPLNALFLYIGKRSPVLEDWQALLLLDGVPAVVAGLLALLLLPSSPLGCARFLTQVRIPSSIRPRRAAPTPAGSPAPVRSHPRPARRPSTSGSWTRRTRRSASGSGSPRSSPSRTGAARRSASCCCSATRAWSPSCSRSSCR